MPEPLLLFGFGCILRIQRISCSKFMDDLCKTAAQRIRRKNRDVLSVLHCPVLHRGRMHLHVDMQQIRLFCTGDLRAAAEPVENIAENPHICKKFTGDRFPAVHVKLLGQIFRQRMLAAELLDRQTLELLDDMHIRDTTARTAKTLLSIAIPITLGSAGLQIINLIDAKIVMQQLLGPAGFVQADADVLKGIYNFCQTIFNLPCAFITPLTVSIIPAVTEHLTLKSRLGARRVEESGLRIMALLSMPCAVGLAVLAGPILQMLRGYQGDNLKVGAVILAVLGAAVVFNSLVLLTNAIMQAHGFVSLPVINMLIGGIVKVIVNYILVGRPGVNIMGAPIGTENACFALGSVVVSSGLNLYLLAGS